MSKSLSRSLFGFFKRDQPSEPDDNRDQASEPDDDCDWFWPPGDVHDVQAWDKYWRQQIENGLGPPIFDMFCRDKELVEAMRRREMKTVLCAGNGISQEPRALAEAGFDVTVLDSSVVALEIAQRCIFTVEDLKRYYPLDLRQAGGNITYVAGSLLDPKIAPGLFDVVIERCTLQLFPPAEKGDALQSLTDRLTPTGIFVSHCHNGGWRPEEPLIHPLEDMLRLKGWTIENGYGPSDVQGRVARLSISTG